MNVYFGQVHRNSHAQNTRKIYIKKDYTDKFNTTAAEQAISTSLLLKYSLFLDSRKHYA